VLKELDQIYVPPDEQTLRRVQRKTEDIDRIVRRWAQDVIDVLPKGLCLIEDELYVLGLFLAQQRRLNIELDSQKPPVSLRGKLYQASFFPGAIDRAEILRVAHRTVASRLESDIDRACQFFCSDRDIEHNSEPAIDWRVAIRYLAQQLHHIASQIDLKREYYTSPQRFEVALRARDLAANIAEKRNAMLGNLTPVEEAEFSRPPA